MKDRFTFLNVAVTQLRDAVQDVLNAGATFTRRDTGAEHYEACLNVTDLTENQAFPNVSNNYRGYLF